jgi:uncharacterized protein YjaZ
MKILLAESDFWDSNKEFTAQYKTEIKKAFLDAQKHLDGLPKQLTFVCQANGWECIAETGDSGFTRSSRLILLSLDPGLPYGEAKLLKNIRSTVFHELNHAVRYEANIWHHMVLDNAIMEGLATVFERDYAKASVPLWGNYKKSEVTKWVKELHELGRSAEWNAWLYRHPDGRRWIAYKTGTWIVDEAMKHSGKTVMQLTLMENSEILRLSKVME